MAHKYYVFLPLYCIALILEIKIEYLPNLKQWSCCDPVWSLIICHNTEDMKPICPKHCHSLTSCSWRVTPGQYLDFLDYNMSSFHHPFALEIIMIQYCIRRCWDHGDTRGEQKELSQAHSLRNYCVKGLDFEVYFSLKYLRILLDHSGRDSWWGWILQGKRTSMRVWSSVDLRLIEDSSRPTSCQTLEFKNYITQGCKNRTFKIIIRKMWYFTDHQTISFWRNNNKCCQFNCKNSLNTFYLFIVKGDSQ